MSTGRPTKAAAQRQADDQGLGPFQCLLDHLATLTRNTCSVPGTAVTFERLAEPTPTQRKAFEHINVAIPVRLV